MNRRSSFQFVRSVCGMAVLVSCVFGAPVASAHPDAPKYVQDHYGLSCTPPCLLCHSNPNGGPYFRDAITPTGQAVSGFIITLYTHGFVPDNAHTGWDVAFTAIEQQKIDTDQDGIPDIQELRDGTDPNDGQNPNAQICGNGPTYGCVRVARGTSVDGDALLVSGVVLLAGIALARRRRS